MKFVEIEQDLIKDKLHFKNFEVLALRSPDDSYCIASKMIQLLDDWIPISKYVLKLRGLKDETIAHSLITKHPTWYTENTEILKLVNGYGNSVALLLAWTNPDKLKKEDEILRITNEFGITVAKVLEIVKKR